MFRWMMEIYVERRLKFVYWYVATSRLDRHHWNHREMEMEPHIPIALS